MKVAPISEAALAQYHEFSEEVRKRLLVGCTTYGDESFRRPLHEVVHELQQEALDLAGWGFILYRRLIDIEQMSRCAENIEHMVRMSAEDWTIEHAIQSSEVNGKVAE